MIQRKRVYLVLETKPEVARELAETVLFRANPHGSSFIDETLTATGITVSELMKYFSELAKAVAEFWENCDNMSKPLTLKPHEIRNLYLPLMYAVVFASIGNVSVGNYDYVIVSRPDDAPDRKFLIEFSAKLETVRHYIHGATGQIGNRSAQPQIPTMLTIFCRMDEAGRNAEIAVRDGANVDDALAGYAALVGLSLKEEANAILYTGINSVNFRELAATVVEKSIRTNTDT